MILFFGDSFTSAENNKGNGFVEKLHDCANVNYGVSGSTIGDYSLYPVVDGDLFSMLKRYDAKIKLADKIVLEYGINDASSAIVRNLQIQPVIDFVKCVDYIKQLNPNITIYFLSVKKMEEKIALDQFYYLMTNYYKNIRQIYFRGVLNEDFCQTWVNCYEGILNNITGLVDKVIELPELEKDDWDTDMLHPNDKGYQKIANYLVGELHEDYITNRS